MGFMHNLLVAIMFFFFVLFIIVVFIIGMLVDENCCISESDQICRLYYDLLLHLSNIDDTKILIQKDFQFWVWELLICYPCILYKMQWNYP